MQRIGMFNTHTDPLWRRKEFGDNVASDIESVTPELTLEEATGASIEYDISDADKSGLSEQFLEDYKPLVPLFYQSFRTSLYGKIKLFTPDNTVIDVVSLEYKKDIPHRVRYDRKLKKNGV